MGHAGRLLVATPLIADSNFERSVLLVLAHDDGGAFGVTINRPSDTTVLEVVRPWAELASPPAVLFLGGPVGRDRVIGLARWSGLPPAGSAGPRPVHRAAPELGDLGEDDDEVVARRVVGDWWTVDLNRPPVPGHVPDGVRLFAGSAGWGPGQLEDELAEGAWWPLDTIGEDVMTSDPDTLWARVLRRQPGEMAWFANHPCDPSAN